MGQKARKQGVGGDQRLTNMTEKRERRGMSDERPLDGRGKKKEQENRRGEPRRSDEVMVQEIIFEGKEESRVLTMELGERCRIRRRRGTGLFITSEGRTNCRVDVDE